MDNYKAFCESQLRHIKAKVLEKCKKHETLDSKRSGNASLIQFHGLTILPPVLTREQRAEMQKYQQEALNCENQRKESQDHHLMIRVQTLLESVELRKAPTLQEFIQDDSGILSAVITGCKDTCVDLKNKSVESDDCSVNKWDPSLSSKQDYDRSTMFHLPTSTADEGLPTKGLQEFHNRYAEQGTNHKLQEVSQTIPSDQVQCLEINSPSVNPTLMCQNPYDQNDTSQRSVSSGYVTCDNVDIMGHVSSGAEIFHRQKDGPSMSSDRFFLHETSCDSNKVPCIPGDTLVHFSTKGNPQASKVSVNDVISKHSERENTRDEKTTDLEIPEEPYLMSLQNLLKKSREFRDKQRELKKAKAVEKIIADSLSDKENDDDKSQPGDHNKDKVKKGSNGRVTVMSDKGVQVLSHCGRINQSSGAHEKLSTSMTSMVHRGKQFLHQEMQNTKFQEYDAVNSVVSASGKQTEPANSFTCNVLTQTEDRQKTKTLKDVRICHGVITAPTACFLAPKTSCRDASGNGVLNISSKKFKILPSPEFSKSPVHSKKITGHSRKLLVNTSLSIGNDAGEHCTKNKSTSDLQEDGQENTKRLETEQMTQLEINLSGLKALILDLESTISERSANSTLQENSIICNKSCSQEDCSSLKQTRMQSNKTCKSDSFSRDSKESIQTKSCGASLLQNKRIPDLLEVSNLESRKGYILSDTGNQTPGVESIKQKDMDNMSCHISVNKSYDVDTPSLLWLQGLQLGQEFGCQETSVTPENGKNAQESRVKRRLVMNAGDSSAKRDKDVLKTDFTKRPLLRLHNSVHPSVLERQQLQLKEEHARQISALLEEQKKQQQWIVQQIAEQSQHLHRISFQYPELNKEQTIVGQSAPAKASLTSSIILHNKAYPCSMLSQPRNFMFVTHAKITAVVKGYLTRRLLRTERLTHLIRTIQDSRLLLLTVDSPGKTGLSSHQSRSLGERVLLQLRSALYEVHDIFFNSSASERMQIISHDRKLQKQRQFNQRGHNRNPDKGVSVLSAATLKVLERKRRLLVQRTAAGGQKRQRNVQPGRLVPCKTAHGTRTTVYKKGEFLKEGMHADTQAAQ